MKNNFPEIKLTALDNLWFQVSGTICNISCKHCFNNSSPVNHTFEFLTFEQCKSYIDDAVKIGVKEFYFTGGEPFANNEILIILEYALKFGPATVLTNGMLIKEVTAERLNEIQLASIYTLELRISLDGYTEEMNDKIRGIGVFKKTIKGIKFLYDNNFLPIITITKTWEESEEDIILNEFKNLLYMSGYRKPRLKILPSIKIGQEVLRTKGYENYEYVYEEMLQDYDSSQLICSNTRLVTSKGVYVCPILIEPEDSNLGISLLEASKSYRLTHQACYTCYLYGAICSNFSSGRRDA